MDNAANLGDKLVVVGEMGPAVDTAVSPVAVGQVGLEGFGACHGGSGGRDGTGAQEEGPLSPGRLAVETVENAGEGRGGDLRRS